MIIYIFIILLIFIFCINTETFANARVKKPLPNPFVKKGRELHKNILKCRKRIQLKNKGFCYETKEVCERSCPRYVIGDEKDYCSGNEFGLVTCKPKHW